MRKKRRKENLKALSFSGFPLRLCAFAREESFLDSSPAGHEIDYQHNHGYHQQQVDETSTNMRKQANQP
jgi:hypothetical protein